MTKVELRLYTLRMLSFFNRFAFVACLFLSACVSNPISRIVRAPEPTCAGIDWWEVGRTDGVSGLPLADRAELAHQCAPHEPIDQDLYNNGYDAGLVDYCTSEQGLAAGRAGEPYRDVCPEHLEPAFLTNYRTGLKIRALELENGELQGRIDNLLHLMSQSSSGKNIRSHVDVLRERQSKNKSELANIEGDASN